MPIQLSGSLVITGSITTTGVITMSGSIASASYSSTSDLLQGTGSVGFATTASLLAVSSSQQQISASLLNVIAIGATTGSNSFRANQSITGSLVVSSTITAQTLVVQTVTSSIVYSSGSNIFGSALTNTQTFTGSMFITGSNITANVDTTCFSGTATIGSDIVLSAANPVIYGGTAVGGVSVSNNTGGSYIKIFGASHATTPNTTAFINANSTVLTINESGSVGIGTSTPCTMLHVQGQATIGCSTYRTRIDGSSAGTWISFGTLACSNFLGKIGTYSSAYILDSNNGDISFRFCNCEKAYINSSGQACFLGSITAGNSTFTNGTGLSQVTIGQLGTGYSALKLAIDSTKYSWLLGSQYNIDNGFEITPSTTVGGSTFTTPVFKILNTGVATFSSTTALTIPVGTTAQRPSPTQGMIRMNSTTGQPEWYDSVSTSWVSFASQIGTCTYDVQYLVVGGGGGGGMDRAGAGGAGGYRLDCMSLISGTSYYAIIGAGGASNSYGTQGCRSAFNGISSQVTVEMIGGGAGGSGNNTYAGTAGGSGGGGGNSNGGCSNAGGAGTTGQGNAGGSGVYSLPNYGAGGGGGAGGVGANGTCLVSGDGGVGCQNSICGVSRYYAGGGGAGNYGEGTMGLGGAGGGGNGNRNGAGCPGAANSGGGGGSEGTNSGAGGGAGGSGIVIIRYCGSQRGKGGTIVSCNGHTIHIFLSSTMYTA